MNWKKKIETHDRYLAISFPNTENCLLTNLYDNCTMSVTQDDLAKFQSILKEEKLCQLASKLIANGLLRFRGQQTVLDQENDRFPSVVYWGLTDRCNLRCRYCYGCFGENKEAVPLSRMDACTIIDRSTELGVQKINLTGGEASLHPLLFQIAEQIRAKGIDCGLLTNAQAITAENAGKYKVFSYVKVSLDSQYADLNDACRGSGSYQKTIESLSLLRRENIPVSIGCVINRLNYRQIDSFQQWLEDRFGITDVYPAYLTPTGRGTGTGLDLSEDQVLETENQLFTRLMKDDRYRQRALKKQNLKRARVSTRCGMGMTEVFLNYAGQVYPCRATYEPDMDAGNLLTDPPETILDRLHAISDQYDVARLSCRDCDFRFLCSGGCRVYHKAYTGSWTINSPVICRRKINEICHSIILNSGLSGISSYTYQVISLTSETNQPGRV